MIVQRYECLGIKAGAPETIQDYEDRERTIRIHQRPLLNYNLATFTISTPKELQVHINVPCHMSLDLVDDATYYSSCYDRSWIGNHPAGDAYYDWLTSDESPYRRLFTHSKPERILPKDGRGGGFILDAKNVKDLPDKWPLYNFMIAMRMVSEEYESIKTWYTMVDLGLHPADALYLSRMFLLQKYQGSTYLRKYGDNDGHHWPLSDDFYGDSDSFTHHSFSRFRNGDMRITAEASSRIWWDGNYSERQIFKFTSPPDAQRSGTKFYAPIRVIDAFKEYLEANKDK